MTKLRLAAAALAAGAVTLVASPAMAYPDPVPGNLSGSAADGQVGVGENIVLSGDFGGTDCTTWNATLEPTSAAPQSGSGTTFSVNFPGQAAGQYAIAIACTYEDNTTSSAASGDTALQSSFSSASLADATQTKVLTFAIQVGNGGDSDNGGSGVSDGNGALPNTGGSSLWLAVAAGALVVAGATTYTVRRRTA